MKQKPQSAAVAVCQDSLREFLRTPEGRELYEKARAKWNKKLKPLIDANRASQRITGDDLNIHVGGHPDC